MKYQAVTQDMTPHHANLYDICIMYACLFTS